MVETLWQDIRYAARQIRRSRAYAITVIAVLALGVSANAAVFSIVNAAFLKPLPAPSIDIAVITTLTATALVAALLPALRAARVNPVAVLRVE